MPSSFRPHLPDAGGRPARPLAETHRRTSGLHIPPPPPLPARSAPHNLSGRSAKRALSSRSRRQKGRRGCPVSRRCRGGGGQTAWTRIRRANPFPGPTHDGGRCRNIDRRPGCRRYRVPASNAADGADFRMPAGRPAARPSRQRDEGVGGRAAEQGGGAAPSVRWTTSVFTSAAAQSSTQAISSLAAARALSSPGSHKSLQRSYGACAFSTSSPFRQGERRLVDPR